MQNKKTVMVASEMGPANEMAARRAARPMKQLVAVVKRGDASFWTRIGVAFENRDGSWALRFDYLPTDPATTIQLREFRRDEPEAAPAELDEGLASTPF